ncbi:rRNA maturation RNase YbeY [Parathermosynechococcus lividus]|jgi:probable rRNA maturation factor|uniref:Endoribonuclease YbeY n=1 Tax=Parathermosynechococcus lividus PCC 6715 TaxID=1917166 RepID=A0A2D2Q202_PARLV|nr:rRNA maturation RNase YbeY [Thermostichus lividus]ATS18506.1 rRNA maturation RNase YbeY [Thermostichus lividus PCC 6715]
MSVTVYVEVHQPLPGIDLAALPWQQWLQIWLHMVEPASARSYELTLRFTSDQAIQRLNHQFRHRDQPTDVLAFATRDEGVSLAPGEPEYLGDVIISVETAIQQAQVGQHPPLSEVAWLASHGLLHLLGWDHPDATQLAAMLAQQAQCLQAVGLAPPPLIFSGDYVHDDQTKGG